MKAPTIFGRDPAVWVGLIQAALTLAAALWLDWSNEQVGAVVLVVVLVGDGFVAWVTHDTMLGVVVGLVKALAGAALAFGYEVSAETLAAVVSFVTVGTSFFQRTQTFPSYDPPKAVPGATPVSEVGTR
jgi:hypothetical protein